MALPCCLFTLVFYVLIIIKDIGGISGSSISNPLRDDADIHKVIPDYYDTKRFKPYHNSTPSDLTDVPIISYNSPDPTCNVGFRLLWSSQVGSSVFGTPVIFPAGDGKKQIFVNTFYQSVEVLNRDGFKPWGWPLEFEDSSFQGSPLLYDIDGDGKNDIGIVDKNANLFWVRVGDFGQYLEDYHTQVPKLKIKRDWAKTLDPNFIDNYALTSMFDHQNDHMYRMGWRYGGGGEENAGNKLFVKAANGGNYKGSSGKVKPDYLGVKSVKKQETYPELATKPQKKKKEKKATSQQQQTPPIQPPKEEELLHHDHEYTGGLGSGSAGGADVNNNFYHNHDTDFNTHHLAGNEEPHHDENENLGSGRRRLLSVEEEEQAAPPADHQQNENQDNPPVLPPKPADHVTGEPPKVEKMVAEPPKAADELAEDIINKVADKEPEPVVPGGSESETVHHASASSEDSTGSHAQPADSVPHTEHGEMKDTEGSSQHEHEHHDEHSDTHNKGAATDGVNGVNAGTQEHNNNSDADHHEETHEQHGDHPSIHDGDIHSPDHAEGGDIHSPDHGEGGDIHSPEHAAGEVGAEDAHPDPSDPFANFPMGSEWNHNFGDNGRMSYGMGADDFVPRNHDYRPPTEFRSFDDGNRYYGARSFFNESNFVFVDPHVLGSPVLADVNNDGHVEVLVAVSYYFDKAEYAGKELDFDPSMYVAGGIACWDLQDQDWTWMVHLDLTTDKTRFQAMIYSTPTVVDLDGDGRSEVVLGTSLGLLYVLDGDSGFVKRFFPMQFHEIQAQVAVADIMGGPALEIIVADMGGTVAIVNIEGEVLWDAKLSGTLPHTPTVGDVDGDGQLDVVIVAASKDGSSHLWVLRGDTGQPLDGYPMALPAGAKASAPVVLVDLHDYSKEDGGGAGDAMTPERYADPNLPHWMANTPGHQPAPAPSMDTTHDINAAPNVGTGEGGLRRAAGQHNHNNTHGDHQQPKPRRASKGLHMLVSSFDGHVYVIEGSKRCAERIDLGEHIYSMPLIDDVTGDGYLDLVVGTLNGQIHLLETSIPYHPLNAWSAFPKHRTNSFTHGVMGISVPLEERKLLARADIMRKKDGVRNQLNVQNLTVTFDIFDTRPRHVDERKYTVVFTKGTNKISPLAKVEYTKPGRYSIDLPLSPPESFLLVIGMSDEHGQYFEDTVPVSVSTKFYVWIKYMVLFPAVLLFAPLVLIRKSKLA